MAYLLNFELTANVEITSDVKAWLEQLAFLTDEKLWKAATSTASEDDNDLLQQLLEKRQREGLTSNELEQLQDLSNYCNQIMMIRAKSVAILSERGHDISTLLPSSESFGPM